MNTKTNNRKSTIDNAITVRRKRISPEIAAAMLSKNHSNRRLNKQIVARYSRVLSEGGWRLNGETIKIDPDGGLIDGQHRLNACVETGIAFEAFVAEGVDREVFDTIDTGKGRTAGDALYASGQTANSPLMASIANLAIKADTDSLRLNRYIEPHKIRQWVEANMPAVRDAAVMVQTMRFLGFGPVIGLTHMIATKADPEKAAEFFKQLLDGEGLHKGDPAHTLRETLIKHKSDRSYHKADVLAMAVTAWRTFLVAKSLPVLKRNMRMEKVESGVEAFVA